MRRFGWACSLTVAAVMLVGPGVALAQTGPHPGASGEHHKAVCAAGPSLVAHCLADVVTNADGTPLATPATLPPGYGPADLQNAYNLASAVSAGGGSGKTVAIVDAYHDPNAEADLGVYRSTYGLSACTTANACFKQVNETGGTGSPPATDGGWAQEISLDLDMVSAICPGCHILLVEANSASYSDLGKAVNEAASLGANAISNSYGGGESSLETLYDSYYNHPGVNVTVSSGDNGYGVEYPAASQYVTAVGGTSLSRSSSARGWSETAWSGAGSGCSAYEPKPSWQKDTGCSRRTVADVSAVADPNTGVAVYDSLAYGGSSGWMVFGGTSVASPITASVDALSSTFRSLDFPYANPSQFFDVASGSNGNCGGSYLCTALPNAYDGPTGIGTPNGAGSVTPPTSPPANDPSSPPKITGSPAVGQTLTATTGTWTNSPISYSYQWESCSSTCANVGSNSSTYTVQSTDVGDTVDVIVTAANNVGSSSAKSSSVGPVPAAPADFTVSAPASASVKRSGSTQLSVTVNPKSGFNSPTTMSVSGLPGGISPVWSTNPATPGTATTLKLTATSRAQTGTFTVTIKGAAGTLSHTTTTRLTVTRF